VTPEQHEEFNFRRIQLVTQMERDRQLIATYRDNEQFYINRLVQAARKVGELDERLRDES
jgi:hypothetical protein